MQTAKVWCALSLMLGLSISASAYAQSGYYGDGDSGGVFRCESNDGRQNYCAIPAGAPSAQMVRQLSRTACIRNQTWGTDRGGIWVSGGCRAEFVPAGYDYGRRYDRGRSGDGNQLVRCESSDGRYRQCNVSVSRGGDARLVRKLSRTECIEGTTWGVNRMGIWVDKGCRGEFALDSQRRGDDRYRPYPGNGYGGDPYGGGPTQNIRCESRDSGTTRCAANAYRGVQLLRQLSNSACTEGRTWGWNRNEIWVSQGCRAEFAVR